MNSQSALPPLQAYKYCPKCAGRLQHTAENVLKCAVCGYNFFVNAAPAVGVLILNDKNEALLAKRKFEPYKGTWDIPGGFMQLGETYEEAQKREIMEELGVTIGLGKFLGSMLGTYPYKGVALPFVGFYSTASIASGEIRPQDDVEEARFFSKTELETLDITYETMRPLLARCMIQD